MAQLMVSGGNYTRAYAEALIIGTAISSPQPKGIGDFGSEKVTAKPWSGDQQPSAERHW